MNANLKTTGYICIICLGLIIISVLAVPFFSHSNRYDSKREKEIDPSLIPGLNFKDNTSTHIILNTSLSNETPNMAIYKLSEPLYNLSCCREKIEEIYPSWLDDTVSSMTFSSPFNSTLFRKGGEDIEIRITGGFYYNNNSASNKIRSLINNIFIGYMNSTSSETVPNGTHTNSPNNNTIAPPLNGTSANAQNNNTNVSKENETQSNKTSDNETMDKTATNNSTTTNHSIETITYDGEKSIDEAYNISIKYIESHGGFPQNCTYSSHHVRYSVYQNKQIASEYKFQFQRNINGYNIVNKGGDGIQVSVSSLGEVTNYNFLLRDIIGIDQNITVKHASEAFDFLNITVHGNFTVENVGLGYFYRSWEPVPMKLEPIWIFYINQDNTEYLCVDAVSLKYCY